MTGSSHAIEAGQTQNFETQINRKSRSSDKSSRPISSSLLISSRRLLTSGMGVHSLVHCNATALPMYRLISTAVGRNALHLLFTSLQYRNAVVGSETEIRPQQLNYRNADAVDYE